MHATNVGKFVLRTRVRQLKREKKRIMRRVYLSSDARQQTLEGRSHAKQQEWIPGLRMKVLIIYPGKSFHTSTFLLSQSA